MQEFFIAKINNREKMSNTLNKYITSLEYVGKTLVVLSDTCSDVSLFSFTAAIGTLVGVASTSISLVFLVSNGIIKIFLKTMGMKK